MDSHGPDPQPQPRDDAGAPPKRLGGYELLGRLGKGGMGTVLKARQISLDRLVALKILPQRLAANEQFVQRFLREARSAARLRHPHIVQAIDVGQVEGYYVFAMEYVDGETLEAILRREGPLEPERALRYLKQTTSALAAAHDAGLVHRDIKPSNLMIDRQDEVRVTDFGLAKRTEGDIAVTADGQTLGTPAYVAPESAKGGQSDARSDLYSLGATFFQLLAGRPPFEGQSFSEVLIKKATENPPPLASLAPSVDRRLCHIIDRLLRKNPDGRYPTAKALLDDLEGLGKLQTVAQAARAEARAGMAEARTLALPSGRSFPLPPGEGRVRDAAKKRVGRANLHAAKSPWLLVAGGLLLAAIAGFLLLRPGSDTTPSQAKATPLSSSVPAVTKPVETPKPTSKTDNRKPKTPTPSELAPTGGAAFKEAETRAQALLADQRFGDAAAVHENLARGSDDLRLKNRVQEAIAAIHTQADAAYADLDRRAKEALAAMKYDEARAALRPAIDRFGLPLLVGAAKKLIEEIETAEKADSTAKAAKETPKEDEAKKAEEERLKGEAAEQEARDRALAAYGAESEKVWGHLKKREYDEAEKLIAELSKRPDFKLATAQAKADAEAAALIKDFWAGAEAGVAASKGKFLLVAGAAGAVEGAKDGLITLRKGDKTEDRKVTQLAAKQALHYFRQSPVGGAAAGGEKTRSNLMVGVFFLAEGVALDEARQALDAAGDSPAVAFYKERSEALKMGAAEAAAKTAWLRLQDAAKPGITPATAKRLTDLLGDFEKKHGETKIHKGVAKAAEDLKTRIEDSLGYTKWPFDEAEAKRRQKATADALGVKVEQDIDLGGGVKMTFVLIPAGEFLMGSPPTTSPEKLEKLYGKDRSFFYEDEFPQHRVKISRPFWMAKYEVTQEQWFAVFQTNPSYFKVKAKNPVEQVDWNQARGFAEAFSEKLGKTFRLPAEAEWEYACRAGTATEFYFGNDATKLADFGWFGVKSTMPVGMKKANAWGLCDMAGNVWEWCEDWFGKYESGGQTDPKGASACERRVVRGGSWYDNPWSLRSAWRYPEAPAGIHYHRIGFRVVFVPGPR